ncbi:hypothetical protein MUK42_04613, partial [Musa troglodytarum]
WGGSGAVGPTEAVHRSFSGFRVFAVRGLRSPHCLSPVVSLHSSTQSELFCVLSLPANGRRIVLKSGKRVRLGCSYSS